MTTVVIGGEEWDLSGQLGQGGFGRVFRAFNRNGEKIAVKMVQKDSGYREVEVLDLLQAMSGRCNNVIPLRGSATVGDEIAIAMPIAEYSLRTVLTEDPLTTDEVRPILIDIASGLDFLHTHAGIVHRDVKPENVLFHDSVWKISDFGISRIAPDTSPSTHKGAGDARYSSPEQWNREHVKYPSDIFSLGVVIWEMLTGKLPFEPGTQGRPFPLPPTDDDTLTPLARRCLLREPDLRPRIRDVLDDLCRDPVVRHARTLHQSDRILQAESDRIANAADKRRAASETKDARYNDAVQRLETIRKHLRDAADSRFLWTEETTDSLFSLHYGTGGTAASLAVSDARQYIPPETKPWRGFEIVASSSIAVTSRRADSGWRGMSHALWYCRPGPSRSFGWYCPAFDYTNPDNITDVLRPFSLPPAHEAFQVLRKEDPGMRLTFGFTAVDDSTRSLTKFCDSWLNWLGAAATDTLRPEHIQPSSDPDGTYSPEPQR